MACIAYCILAYKEPERVTRLVNRLQTDSDTTFIHFDNAVGEQKFRDWKRFIEEKCPNKNLEIVSKFRCNWGSFGIVDANLAAMSYFERVNYDYFINLTGECYPLKPAEVIKEELDGQKCGFMEFFKMPQGGWANGGMNRIQNRHYFIRSSNYPYVRGLRIPRLKRKLPLNLEPYGGSGWFCLPKQLISYIVEFVNLNPDVKKFFRPALTPDEMFFQTILMNSPLRSKIVNDNKRYIDFGDSATGAHPRILTRDDFEKLKKSEKLFARKFSTQASGEILDLIDQEIEKTEVSRNMST
jgi:hypothetical protein